MAWKIASSLPIRNLCAQIKISTRGFSQSLTKDGDSMRFVQFLRGNGKQKRLGVLSEDGNQITEVPDGTCGTTDMIKFISHNYSISELQEIICGAGKEPVNDSITFLPPITNPGKIICIGLNYKDHCEEQNKPLPEEPIFFSKFATTLIGANDSVVAPKCSKSLDWEVELAVVIGKKAKNVSRENAMDYVFGYTIAQDITARDWQKARNGGQWLLGKSMDGFCPMGPSITHKCLISDVNNLTLQTFINGVEKQCGNSSNMIFKIDDVISRLTENITLLPGDIILTGTPKGVGVHRNPPESLKPGDIIESRIQGLGKMVNKVVSQD